LYVQASAFEAFLPRLDTKPCFAMVTLTNTNMLYCELSVCVCVLEKERKKEEVETNEVKPFFQRPRSAAMHTLID